jgi:hypothetical protein
LGTVIPPSSLHYSHMVHTHIIGNNIYYVYKVSRVQIN